VVALLVTFFALSPFAVVAVAMRHEGEKLAKKLLRDAGFYREIDVDMATQEVTFKDATPHVLLTFSHDVQTALMRIDRALVGRAPFTLRKPFAAVDPTPRGSEEACALLMSPPLRAILGRLCAPREVRLLDDGSLVLSVGRFVEVPFFGAPRAPIARGAPSASPAEVTLADLRHNVAVLRELASALAPLSVVRAGDDATSGPSGAPVPVPFGGDRD
jgi:hypothetical protein